MREANNRKQPASSCHEPNAVPLGPNMIGKIFTRYGFLGRKAKLPNFAED
jgi:hypothetical protein